MNFNKRCISKEEFKKYEDSDVAYALYVRDNLKPNDYFRTFDGQIFKSMNVSPIEGNKIYYLNGDYTWVDVSAVDNFSDDIINLIERDDLLEIRYLIKSNEYQKEVVQVIKNYAGKLYINSFPRMAFIEDFDKYGIEILSIVTKEQFASVKYEVE